MTITGGPVFWLIMALAIVAVVVFIERWMELRRAQIDWQDFIKGVVNVLDAGNEDEAIAICEDTGVPVSSVVAMAIRHRNGPVRSLREAVDAQGRTEINRLDRRLVALSVIGQITPLLGLFGAIVGFVKTMMLVNGSAVVSRTELMSGSMEALVSGAIGLAVAIPVAVMYAFLRVRLDRCVSELEAAATLIVGYVAKGDGE